MRPKPPQRWAPQGLRPVAKRVPTVQRRTATDPVTPLPLVPAKAGTQGRRSGLGVPGLASLARDTKSWIPAGVYPRASGGGNERSLWPALAIAARRTAAQVHSRGRFHNRAT